MRHAIQVRNVSEDVHESLKKQAAAAGLSLSEFLRFEMTRIARRPPVSEVLEAAASRPGGARLQDALEAQRHDRDGH